MKNLWKEKRKILEGLTNTYFGSDRTHLIAQTRAEICQECPHWDKEGTSSQVVIKGQPACSLCGCNTKVHTHCLSCSCSDEENPRWDKIEES